MARAAGVQQIAGCGTHHRLKGVLAFGRLVVEQRRRVVGILRRRWKRTRNHFRLHGFAFVVELGLETDPLDAVPALHLVRRREVDRACQPHDA